VLTIACCLWDANEKSRSFSRCYDESWVEKLYRGFVRNLTVPFHFVCFTDRLRDFHEGIAQETLWSVNPDYGALIEPFRLNVPTIVCGLDTVIVGSIDHLVERCLTSSRLALPRISGISNNGFVLVPAGQRRIFDEWRGENDMEWLREQPHDAIDDHWPGQVVSYKLHVRPRGLGDARAVYFHGEPKPPALMHLDWVRANWR
jgi:hypothetical protein